jgi:Ni,Fe-hydrogenase III large subunit/Ni,Fe-hydrogenase III component G
LGSDPKVKTMEHDFIKETLQPYGDEQYLTVDISDFAKACITLHKEFTSPVMMFFAEDERNLSGNFVLYCVFLDVKKRSWIIVRSFIHENDANFTSLAKDIYSASLFEREIKEMFGILPQGNPDLRRLKLHDEVWPLGAYPLRKDVNLSSKIESQAMPYQFKHVEGEGIFEVPVGPVHAGIIGPGHFRFSVAGEPIINLELRLGWTHRGIEKLLEGKIPDEALKIFECISGDAAFAYSSAFCSSVEKIFKTSVPQRAQVIRAMLLELERIYNHGNSIGGIALDVGFSFAAQFATLIKENILQLNDSLCGSRYLKGFNAIGGVIKDIDQGKRDIICQALLKIEKDFTELETMLFNSISFMDRVDTTGILRAKTARDIGVVGLAARASAIGVDMRKILPSITNHLSFKTIKEQTGDVSARLKVRCKEVRESIHIINQCLEILQKGEPVLRAPVEPKEGFAIGCVEAWRGPVMVWARINKEGRIERAKIVDPSFHNWEALSFAALGNIVPDFPVCNKSFDLSYSGNDL